MNKVKSCQLWVLLKWFWTWWYLFWFLWSLIKRMLRVLVVHSTSLSVSPVHQCYVRYCFCKWAKRQQCCRCHKRSPTNKTVSNKHQRRRRHTALYSTANKRVRTIHKQLPTTAQSTNLQLPLTPLKNSIKKKQFFFLLRSLSWFIVQVWLRRQWHVRTTYSYRIFSNGRTLDRHDARQSSPLASHSRHLSAPTLRPTVSSKNCCRQLE